jgi:hypothetical protein
MKHDRMKAEQVAFSTHYSAKNYSVAFKCPACGKTQRQSLNFLGGKLMVCDGEKMHKVSRREFQQELDMKNDAAPTKGETLCAA